MDRVIEVDIASNGCASVNASKRHGHLVVYGSGAAEFSLPFPPMIAKHLTLNFFLVYDLSQRDHAAVQALLTGLLQAGTLQHQVSDVFALEQVVQAHQLVESRRGQGNAVLALP